MSRHTTDELVVACGREIARMGLWRTEYHAAIGAQAMSLPLRARSAGPIVVFCFAHRILAEKRCDVPN